MIPGRLDRYVTLQTAGLAQDDSGQTIPSWSDFAGVWAERRGLRGSERYVGGQTLPARVATFIVRWIEGIDEVSRLVDVDGSIYDIKGIAEDQRRGFVEITGEAQNPAATGAS